jgi:hypothetical protein
VFLLVMLTVPEEAEAVATVPALMEAARLVAMEEGVSAAP